MQRRRRYDLKLSGLTGHVLDLFLLLINSPNPTTGYASSWSGLLDGNFVRKLYGNEYLVFSFGTLWYSKHPLMKRLYGSGLGTGTYIFEASWAYFSKKWCYGQVSNSVHMKQVETITFNFLTFQLCLCTYSICLYYYYDDIQIQSACIMIVW